MAGKVKSLFDNKYHIVFDSPLEIKLHPDSLAALEKMNKKLDKIIMLLDDLQSKVDANTSAEQSAVVLLQGLKAALDAAGTDAVKLKALSDQLGKNTDDLAAAVVANTPSA